MFHNHEHAWNTGVYELFDKPQHIDACGHSSESWIGSASGYDNSKGVNNSRLVDVDVYVFNGINTECVCIRYSNECSDYYSPGTVLDTIVCALRPGARIEYKIAAHLIDKYLELRTTKRPTPKKEWYET